MRYQERRDQLTNMATEFVRLVKLCFDRQHMRTTWEMAGTTGVIGRPHRFVKLATGDLMKRPDADPEGWRHDDLLEVPRDRFDQIYDFVLERIDLFVGNVFVQERCSHPHDQVIVSWDGDEDTGWCSQHECRKCRGCMSGDRDVDRYLPPEQRHPELITRYAPPAAMMNSIEDQQDDRGSMGGFEDDLDYDDCDWRARYGD